MHSKLLHWGGWICAAIGLIDLPDQIQRWLKLFISWFGIIMNADAELLGNTGRWIFFLIGIVLLSIAYELPQKIRSKWFTKQRATKGYLPLNEAAARLYTECRAAKSMWAMGAEKMSGRGMGQGSPEDILDYMAVVISGKKDIYGKRVPSNAREKISEEDLHRSRFIKGATRLEHFFPGSNVYFTDLEMKSSDFDELIETMHFESAFKNETESM